MDQLGEFFDAGSFFLFNSVGVQRRTERGNRVGKSSNHFLRPLRIAANPRG